MTDRRPVTVSELTLMVKDVLARTPDFEDALVEGEISNLSRPVSGHIYFTLKDKKASLRCVAFRMQAQKIPFAPENGMTVIAHGRIDVYEQGGTYQLYVDRLEPAGIGALHLAVEQTRRKLAAEGLFEETLKRPLALLPRRVVVVTSKTGAAWRDVCNVIRRRAPGVDIVLSPAVVQGDGAADVVVKALSRAGIVRDADVVLLVRGGGSLEDLMAFNDEKVARAIRSCPVPVITGIGHETDLTIADWAADRRAPTPSAAAELAVPAVAQLALDVRNRAVRLAEALRTVVARQRREMDALMSRLQHRSPQHLIPAHRMDLDHRATRLRSALLAEVAIKRRGLDTATARLRVASPAQRVPLLRQSLLERRARMDRAMTGTIREKRAKIQAHVTHLEAVAPQRVLERGYSMTTDAKTGELIRDAARLRPGQRLRTAFAAGQATSEVVEEAAATDPAQ